MAQTGYTPIQLYYSSTTTNAPTAGNLAGGELAINITDGKLFYKDNANAVQVIAWKTTPTSAGGTGLTSYTAGDTLYYASGTTLTKLAIGTAYQAYQVNAGATAPSWQPSASSVLSAQGDLLYASGANTLARLAKDATATRYLSNTGTSNNPAWAQVDITNGVTGTLPATSGGTGQSTVTTGDLLYGSATNTWSKLADVATGNALISGGIGVAPSWGKIGLTTHVSGTLPTANGGTNLTSFTANGLVYASSTSALATSSAITFDGSNFATTGTASATKFIPTGGSATGNGMYLPASNEVAISTAGVERLRYLSDGTILAGTTDSSFFANNVTGVGLYASSGFVAASRNGALSGLFNRYTSDGDVVQFRREGNAVGSVSVTTVLTTYNTTSDYRLKTVVGLVTGQGERIDALKPIEYTWNSNGSQTRGFLAHEFKEVYADSVTGKKDAVDDDGNPVYQSMQAGSSEVIADLIAELQSLRKRVAFLEAK
jgi:hypothetical protein